MEKNHARLSDTQWEIIKHFLDWQRKPKLDLRDFFDTIWCVGQIGILWQKLHQGGAKYTALMIFYKG